MTIQQKLVRVTCINCSRYFAIDIKKNKEYYFCCPYCQVKARFSDLGGTHWTKINIVEETVQQIFEEIEEQFGDDFICVKKDLDVVRKRFCRE